MTTTLAIRSGQSQEPYPISDEVQIYAPKRLDIAQDTGAWQTLM